MKALTIWQPHASLLAIGVRTIETRGWSTTYRGPLVIHAAKKWDGRIVRDVEHANRCYVYKNPEVETGPRWSRQLACYITVLGAWKDTLGKALGVVDLVDCRPIPEPCGTDADRCFGEFGPDRFGLFLENPRPFDKPIPCIGRQGRPWEWSEGIPW